MDLEKASKSWLPRPSPGRTAASWISFDGASPETESTQCTDRLFTLPRDTLVLPAHDYKGHRASTIGVEARSNPRLILGKADFAEFMRQPRPPVPQEDRRRAAGEHALWRPVVMERGAWRRGGGSQVGRKRRADGKALSFPFRMCGCLLDRPVRFRVRCCRRFRPWAGSVSLRDPVLVLQ